MKMDTCADPDTWNVGCKSVPRLGYWRNETRSQNVIFIRCCRTKAAAVLGLNLQTAEPKVRHRLKKICQGNERKPDSIASICHYQLIFLRTTCKRRAVNRQLPTSAEWVLSQIKSHVICGNEARLLQVLRVPLPNSPYSPIIQWARYWTLPHPTPRNYKQKP
jgi:hypothetical protein